MRDPTRALAWRLLHDPELANAPRWLKHFLPHPPPFLDNDPVALLLAAGAVFLAWAYLGASLFGSRALVRRALLAAAALWLVVLPTVAFVTQLPLALDRILDRASPYAADYSDSILGKESRASGFWAPYGGNPILRHHAYLPGTHVLMMPFYLLARVATGFFDTRIVTLLAFVVAALLATRLVDGPFRIAAAAVVLLNPLVYWQQIFGANDILFVALLLATAVLGQRGRPLVAAAALGLACATKQLAWPYAPFLLLYLAGAEDWTSFRDPAFWRRLRGPAAIALAVFLLTVAPIALLDPSAFYADVVAYNIGLPGADKYPLGGTPGLGFANFVIYFGRVATLRDDVSFAPFYLLLLPLGLLLVRFQLRARNVGAALLAGSAALFATLYLSRVVHPNYFTAVAVLLPLGMLAARKPADFAVAPFLLLGLAGSVADLTPLRLTWEQAVAWGLPAGLTGLGAMLAPRAGPGLTDDPLSLAWSATAAGLGLLYLIAALLGASGRTRGLIAGLAAVAVVGAPAILSTAVASRTDLPRVQDPWAVQAIVDGNRLTGRRSPYVEALPIPIGREAWTSSFRLEPPRTFTDDHPLMPPGASVASLLARPFRGDARIVTLAALSFLLLAASRVAGGGGGPAALAVAALCAPLAFATVFGSGQPLTLAVLAAAWLAARRGRVRISGALMGLAIALSHRSLLALPLLWMAPAVSPLSRRRMATGFAISYLAIVAPVVALNPAAFWSALVSTDPGTGLGLDGFLQYGSRLDMPFAHAIRALAPLILVALGAGLLRSMAVLRLDPGCTAGWLWLTGLLLLPGTQPCEVLAPILVTGLVFFEPDPVDENGGRVGDG